MTTTQALYPLFLMVSALLACLVVLALQSIIHRAIEFCAERFNGMSLTIFKLEIFPKEK